MIWKLSLPDPKTRVYYFVKFLGLAPFTLTKSGMCSPTVQYLIYPIFLCVVYLLCVSNTLGKEVHSIDDLQVKTKPLAITIRHLHAVPSILFTLIVCSLMYKKVVDLINKLSMIGHGFWKIGIQENHEKFFKNLLATITLTNIFIIAVCVTLTVRKTNWRLHTVIQWNIENWYTVNIVLIYAQLLLCIKQRFTLLNQKFLDMYTPTRHDESPQDPRMHLGSNNPSDEVLKDIQRLLKIEGLHMDLCNLVDQTANLFTTTIISISLQIIFILSSSCLFIFSTVQTSSQPDSISEIIFLVNDKLLNIIFRSIIPVIELYIVAHASVVTRREGEAMKAMLIEVWRESTPQDLQDEFLTFYLQLMHKSGSIALLGFFDLDYSYVYKILSAVGAYIIIIVQFNVT